PPRQDLRPRRPVHPRPGRHARRPARPGRCGMSARLILGPEAPREERWRPVVGHEGHYEVSDQGRIRSVPHVRITKAGQRYPVRGQLLTPAVHPTGYPQVYLSVEGKTVPRKVHALVAEAFIGPRPEGHQIAHNDGDRLNSRLENLRYATAAEN